MNSQTLHHLLKTLQEKNEISWIEAKKNLKDLEQIGKTISAVANSASHENEEYGYILWGIENATWKIVGTDFSLEKAKKSGNQAVEIWLHHQLGKNAHWNTYEFEEEGKRVFVMQIQNAGNTPVLFQKVGHVRVGSHNQELSQYSEIQRSIFSKNAKRNVDWSAEICEESSLESVDETALLSLKRLYQQKNPHNKNISSLSDEQFLTDISLMEKGKLNNAGVVLLAKKEFLDKNLANAEISFEYRNTNKNLSANERIDYREPFVLAVSKIWEKVISRQQVHSFIDGLFRRDIPAFNEEVFREALFNAVCHRDYTHSGSLFIKQSPEEIEITNPGGFPLGVNAENIITVPSTPRNRLLAEIFQKILPGVERSGQGADKIFRLTIEEGKGLPDYSKSDEHYVILKVPAMLQDGEFIQYLEKITNEKQVSLPLTDLLLLENIREGKQEGLTLKELGHLVDNGFIELHGKTRGAKYILSQKYYQETGLLGKRTRKIGLSRDKCKELILEHIRKNKRGTMSEFMQIFPELKRSDVSNLLAELKKDNRIIPERKGPASPWILYNKIQ